MQTDSTTKNIYGSFLQIVEQCSGCDRIVEVEEKQFCKTYANPGAKWRLGVCNFATHMKSEANVIQTRINPLKASKRAAKKRK
ncbi:PxxKW family cysteine-rich protein [Desulfobulbus oligotrophicus]|jgi:hypothetical protein|uniref:Uncharacterized protein n=1 Tax=Desulfobulbus oligotrophicus TaxID=1909699 RepID=A0A7T5VEM1_9BACT|nr:PxxKW family cysteine-rich protein [Desulfobulbus oligotrophicus]MDY0389844.1 PxxKW family cysteine-rich protein [Desulfobulbus oligotrophicus]QQG66520.1 hypothetical protein HP555_11905 [Desulfobulbus oligotrophicus]